MVKSSINFFGKKKLPQKITQSNIKPINNDVRQIMSVKKTIKDLFLKDRKKKTLPQKIMNKIISQKVKSSQKKIMGFKVVKTTGKNMKSKKDQIFMTTQYKDFLKKSKKVVSPDVKYDAKKNALRSKSKTPPKKIKGIKLKKEHGQSEDHKYLKALRFSDRGTKIKKVLKNINGKIESSKFLVNRTQSKSPIMTALFKKQMKFRRNIMRTPRLKKNVKLNSGNIQKKEKVKGTKRQKQESGNKKRRSTKKSISKPKSKSKTKSKSTKIKHKSIYSKKMIKPINIIKIPKLPKDKSKNKKKCIKNLQKKFLTQSVRTGKRTSRFRLKTKNIKLKNSGSLKRSYKLDSLLNNNNETKKYVYGFKLRSKSSKAEGKIPGLNLILKQSEDMKTIEKKNSSQSINNISKKNRKNIPMESQSTEKIRRDFSSKHSTKKKLYEDVKLIKVPKVNKKYKLKPNTKFKRPQISSEKNMGISNLNQKLRLQKFNEYDQSTFQVKKSRKPSDRKEVNRKNLNTPKTKKYLPKSFRSGMKTKYGDRFYTLATKKPLKLAKMEISLGNNISKTEMQRSPKSKKTQSSKEIFDLPFKHRKSTKGKIRKKSSKNLIEQKRKMVEKKSFKKLSIDKKIIENKSCKIEKFPTPKSGNKSRTLRIPPSLERLKKMEEKGRDLHTFIFESLFF
jgi:hypothetical protein